MHIVLPSKLKVISESEDKNKASGVFEIEGLYPGYGHTLGNSIRRVLLSSLPGAAITAVKIDGAPHEFTTLEGVKEDVLTIILNLKKVRFQLTGTEPQVATLKAKAGRVTAGMFETPGQLEVLNPDQYIAEVTGKGLSIEVTVEQGLGFMPREVLKKEKVEIGTIFTDAFFSPIRKAMYDVDNMRVGDRTDFHKIRLSIETDGTLSAREALESALKTILDQTRAILDLKEQEEHRAEVAAKIMEHLSEHKAESKESSEPERDLTDVLKTRIDSLQFSTRTANALSGGGIRTLGGLIQKTKEDLLELDGFGEKGLGEVEELLTGFGLALKK